jgi:Zn finger protein HypA/HybF involved in hydrogenase expression
MKYGCYQCLGLFDNYTEKYVVDIICPLCHVDAVVIANSSTPTDRMIYLNKEQYAEHSFKHTEVELVPSDKGEVRQVYVNLGRMHVVLTSQLKEKSYMCIMKK